MNKPKHYWFLSDGKTVREIDTPEYQKIAMVDMKKESRNRFADTHQLVTVHDTEIHFQKGLRGTTYRIAQLRQILGKP